MLFSGSAFFSARASVEIISDLQLFGFRLTRHKHPDLGPATLAITQIKGGSSINTIPDRCEVSVDIRLLPEHHPPMIESTLQNMIGPRGTVETLFTAQGMQTDMANLSTPAQNGPIWSLPMDPGKVAELTL